MKTYLRKNSERGGGDFGWLKTKHSFSFGEYYDPSNMGFGALRVLNDDQISGGAGFPPHGHKDMEIFTIPLSGSLSHKDSTGTSSTISPGDIQIMSAGTGVVHSEFNADYEESLTLLQIWITPHTKNLSPRYEEKNFSFLSNTDSFQNVINPTGENGALKIFQEAYVSIGNFKDTREHIYRLHRQDNGLFIFVIEGELELGNVMLQRRDALEITETESISFRTQIILLFFLLRCPFIKKTGYLRFF